ncbi:MAG: protein translocase SEC61 complex subunit gamma [Thermoplasmata archaeon]|uniref:Protein translocase SEC61 complex subunit gamma n=1 Tax=Candidatus Sysuiplasma superficiale TaxID=2823368 RepID=A0A8J7YVJ6_9ARCH|nr:protein translocase SEC61 complex subunit gamma [Candidatus Sysuiplasma superficiale]MBX8643699.1 protein translocase SEC61 complex subunit gamma [Candidatus Sysuiplasma superficiale]MCL4347415.1 protein translocase SEC61 complex subunit gamma [Candidatus Thermoplasmatota archaeon]
MDNRNSSFDFTETTYDVQRKLEERFRNIGKGKYGRIFKMAKKPTMEEYVRVVKLVALGLILIGALGFLLYWLWTYFPAYVPGIFG